MLLDRRSAERFARIALGHVALEYPNGLSLAITGPQDVGEPRSLHPIFYGSFDWHSCVHSHWLLARLLRAFPDLAQAPDIRAHFDQAFTPAKVAGELAYLARPLARGFERPYGWAWLLKLQAELDAHGAADGSAWASVLRPLARAFEERFAAWLPLADYPIRSGVHSSTAFALALALDHAEASDRPGFEAQLRAKALAWYGADRDCQAWEPSGEDFLSPALMEAELMRRVLPPDRFADWFDAFLPRAGEGRPQSLFTPVAVADRTDGRIAHLDGLNLARAWCWRGVVGGLGADHPAAGLALAAAQAHLDAALPHLETDYMGSHWLASFALLALGG